MKITFKNATVEDCLINQGALIFGCAKGSVISNEVTIENGAIVENSVLMPGVVVKKNAVVKNAIIGPNTLINENEIVNEGNEIVLIDKERGLQ